MTADLPALIAGLTPAQERVLMLLPSDGSWTPELDGSFELDGSLKRGFSGLDDLDFNRALRNALNSFLDTGFCEHRPLTMEIRLTERGKALRAEIANAG